MERSQFLGLTTLVFVALATSSFADQQPGPTGPVILTISEGDAPAEQGNGIRMDLAMLMDLPQVEFTTGTIWMDDPVTFTGAALADVLTYAGVTGTSINAIALNDYQVDIPRDAITPLVPIVAYHMDGKPMSPRGKGPLWIVYPYDQGPEFRTEVVYSRSIWQLDRIVSRK